jgi:mono/diheme cytochrome c family protein
MRKTTITFIALFFASALVVSLSSFTHNESSVDVNAPEVVFAGDLDLDASIAAGKIIYEGKGTCSVCHQVTGLGLPPAFPPLAGADYLLADKHRAIKQTMYGAQEPIVVNGTTYPGGMMSVVEMTDQEVRDVVNYILNSWGNQGGEVTIDDVKAQRK